MITNIKEYDDMMKDEAFLNKLNSFQLKVIKLPLTCPQLKKHPDSWSEEELKDYARKTLGFIELLSADEKETFSAMTVLTEGRTLDQNIVRLNKILEE